MFDKQLMRLSNFKKIMGMLAGLDVLQAFLIIGQAIFLSLTITHLWQGLSLASQLTCILGFAGCFLARQGLMLAVGSLLDDYAAKQAKTLRTQFLAQAFKLGPTLVQKNGTGNMVTLALDGIFQAEDYIKLILSKMSAMTIVPVIILLACFWLDFDSAITLLLVFPLIILFMIVLGYAAKAKADRQFTSYQILSNHFIDSLRGLDTLEYFGLSESYAKNIFKTSERFRKATMSTLKVAMLSTFALDFFTTLSIAIVAVFLGLRLINGKIELFPALTILILAPEYFLPIRNFANDYHATLNGKNAFQAIFKIIKQPQPETLELELPMWQQDSQLTLANINYTYPDKQQTALQELNLTFNGFEKIGIIGLSGAGKSTLINLLSGFLQPTQGNFKYNQTDLTTLNLASWRRQISYIPQNPYIFDDTLKNNIRFYTPNVTDEQIMEAIQVVGLDQLVAQLPDGLETLIGNGQRPLSGGQAQRIAFARAFLDQKRHVLIFDEPTAHLDIETEIELKDKMLPLMQNKLVFFATHRLHWMHQMDKILVVKDGQIVEFGTYEQLQANNGYFCQLIQQAKGAPHVK